MYLAPISTIVTLVAAALALLAAADARRARRGWSSACWRRPASGLGSIAPVVRAIAVRASTLGSIPVNPLALAGHVADGRPGG